MSRYLDGFFYQHLVSAIDSFFGGWQIKTFWSFVVVCITTIIHNEHFLYFSCFACLVLLDVLTKQLSISAKNISEKTGAKIEDIDTITKLLGIYPAFHEGKIQSLLMRNKSCSKLLVYICVVIASVLADNMINSGGFITNFTIAYSGANEFLSILENLRDSGNQTIGKYLDLVNNKIMSRLK